MSKESEFTAWSGYAFEQVCLQHVQEIKNALQIGSVITRSSAWTGDDGKRKAQIDLVIDRRDGVINLFEMKFSTGTFNLTKAYSDELREKISLLEHAIISEHLAEIETDLKADIDKLRFDLSAEIINLREFLKKSDDTPKIKKLSRELEAKQKELTNTQTAQAELANELC